MAVAIGTGGCQYKGICLKCDLIFDEFIKALPEELDKVARDKIVPCAECFKTIVITPYEVKNE